MSRRVVITGASGISPIGSDWDTIESNLRAGKNGVAYIKEFDRFEGLKTRLGAPVADFETPEHYDRKQVRSMGRVAIMATRATELALEQSGLLGDPILKSGDVGIAYGSATGSIDAQISFYGMHHSGNVRGVAATTYIKMMSHTAAVNIGVFFGLTGRLIPTCSACTSGSQAIGFGFETIQQGKQTIMICGGAEELCEYEVAVFDTMYAASSVNDAPETTPRPFDESRDGLVIGEGAGTVILEDMEHAIARGAPILAEVVGYGTNTDGSHITRPNGETIHRCMTLALESGNIAPEAVGHVNAHATATNLGDVVESVATNDIFGPNMPISAPKSYTGHMLGGCGAFESWLSIEMMNREWFAPTINLNKLDERCAELDYLTGGKEISTEYVMNNNFAFGGINTSLIFKRWS